MSASWSHACITPTVSPLGLLARTVDLIGTSVSSVYGSASSSARSATVGPGLAPRNTATTPVLPVGVWTSRPSARARAAM